MSTHHTTSNDPLAFVRDHHLRDLVNRLDEVIDTLDDVQVLQGLAVIKCDAIGDVMHALKAAAEFLHHLRRTGGTL